MNRRSLLKLAGIAAVVPVVSKADALRIERGQEPQDEQGKEPVATGRISEVFLSVNEWQRYNQPQMTITLESDAETYEFLSRMRNTDCMLLS